MPIPPKPRIPLVRPEETTFDTETVEAFLIAFGDDDHPLPETVKCLDEIVTEYVAHRIPTPYHPPTTGWRIWRIKLTFRNSYIIETCHEAASVAHHARRAKIKLDDFKFMLRRDTTKLGRVSEMLETDKELKRKRKAFDTDEGAVAKDPGVKEVNRDAGDGGKGKDVEKEKAKGGGGDEGGERKKKKKKKEKRREAGGVGADDASTVRSG
jgi:transcription initiation factor TFIID subunit 13